MKPPAAALKKAVAKKAKAARARSKKEQEPAPKRLKIQATPPPAQEKSPTPPEIDLTADTSPEDAEVTRTVEEVMARAEVAAMEELPEANEAPAGAAPETTGEHPTSVVPPPDEARRDWGEGPSGTAGPPPEQAAASGPPHVTSVFGGAAGGGRPAPTLRNFSRMSEGRRVEGLISRIIQTDFQEELADIGTGRLFREAFSSIVREANTLIFLRRALDDAVAVVSQLNIDFETAQAEADTAKKALESARADCNSKMEAARLQEEAVLKQLSDAESAVAARDLHISDLEAAAKTTDEKVKEAGEDSRLAREETRVAREEALAAREEARVAREEAQQAREEALAAREAERATGASLIEREAQIVGLETALENKATVAVAEFRASEAFTQEVVEANAECFFQGFTQAKEKIAQALDCPRALEIMPDSDSEGSSDCEP